MRACARTAVKWTERGATAPAERFSPRRLHSHRTLNPCLRNPPHIHATHPQSPHNQNSPKLAGTLFQKDLGTLLDKSERAVKITPDLARLMGAGAADAAVALEAARLAKADLATATVMEMTELAGTMGRCAVCLCFACCLCVVCVRFVCYLCVVCVLFVCCLRVCVLLCVGVCSCV